MKVYLTGNKDNGFPNVFSRKISQKYIFSFKKNICCFLICAYIYVVKAQDNAIQLI
jgi:hypothetical protein